MGYYLISCGGTGAKCAEAFVHLAASGLINSNESIKVFFMDADLANGQNVAAQNTLLAYDQAYSALHGNNGGLGDCPLFKNKLEFNSATHIWDPLPNQGLNLDSILDVGNLPPEFQNLYQFLYPEHKRNATFQDGFLGWPSVGSAIISSHQNRLSTFLRGIAADNNAKVFLMGSIFGGTGAASIPTLAKIISDIFNQAGGNGSERSLGLALLLPYFWFNDNQGNNTEDVDRATGQINNPNIDPMNFLLKTKMALDYYYHHGVHDYCDRIYLLGDSIKSLVATTVHKGGGRQRNKPNYMELVAGLSAIDYFNSNFNANAQGNRDIYFELTREQTPIINWMDLPYAAGANQVYQHFSKLVSTGFVYNCRFAPLLEFYRLNPQAVRQHQTWFSRMVADKVNMNQLSSEILGLHLYFKDLFKWVAKLHTDLTGNAGGVNMNLFNHNVLTEYFNIDTQFQPDAARFRGLSNSYHESFITRPPGIASPRPEGFLNPQTGFDLVNNQVNGCKPAPGTRGLGSLFHAIHHFAL